MPDPKVSIIIPVYKAEPFIERCCRSLFEQTLDSIEYIFVDDKTPDDSINILKRVLADYPHRADQVKIVELPVNSKQAAARQAGLDSATGQYIIHCDPDDWVDVSYYEDLYSTAIENHAEVTIGDYIILFSDGNIIRHTNNEYERPIDIVFDNDFFFPSLCWLLISNELITKNCISFYPGINYMEDQGFVSRVLYFANQTAFVHSAYYHYNKCNENAITNTSNCPAVLEQRIECLKLIDEFYRSKGISPLKLGLSLRVKRDIKNSFLSLETLHQWRDLFPEVSSWEFKNSPAPLSYRLCYYLSHKIGLWPMRLYLVISLRAKSISWRPRKV